MSHTALKTKDDDHAKYAPSAWKRIYECPISVYIGDGLPERPETSYSKDGTLAHKVGLEIALKAKLEGDPYPKNYPPEFSKEMIKHAIGLAEFVHKQIEPYLQYKHTWFIEQRVTLMPNVWGTCDFIFLYKKDGILYGILIDYKYGEGIEIETLNNWQVVVYSLAAIKEFSNEKVKLEHISAHIYQPRTDHNPEPIRFDATTLAHHYLPKIKSTVNLVEKWFANKEVEEEDYEKYQNAGDWCQFCKAKPVCKAYQKLNSGKTLKLFKRAQLTVIEDEKGKPKKLTADDIKHQVQKGTISAEDFAFIALNASKLKTYIDLFPPAAKTLLARGEQLPIKMIETQGERSLIPNEKKLVKKLMALGIDEPYKRIKKLLTITEIEKEIGRNKLEKYGLTIRGPKGVKIVDLNHPDDAIEPKKNSARLFKEDLAEYRKDQYQERKNNKLLKKYHKGG